ncbi:MAG: hypothetical protein EA369_06790 [Bradymonadales bacterium]|nr:MAG: hypothetical protein EA369_06790 [Bradymonadales bacterium]
MKESLELRSVFLLLLSAGLFILLSSPIFSQSRGEDIESAYQCVPEILQHRSVLDVLNDGARFLGRPGMEISREVFDLSTRLAFVGEELAGRARTVDLSEDNPGGVFNPERNRLRVQLDWTEGAFPDGVNPERIQEVMGSICEVLTEGQGDRPIPNEVVGLCQTHVERYLGQTEAFYEHNWESIVRASKVFERGNYNSQQLLEALRDVEFQSASQATILRYGSQPIVDWNWLFETFGMSNLTRVRGSLDYLLRIHIEGRNETRHFIVPHLGNGRYLNPIFFVGDQPDESWHRGFSSANSNF